MLNKDFYPTPSNLIHKMLSNINLDQISTILEPSAGKGDLADAILKKTENSTNYYHRRQLPDIDTIEIDTNLQHILKSKQYRVIHNDFLTFQTFKHYDLILANFPFSSGDKHLLQALDLQKNGGQIVCLLNAETLRNPYTNTRKDLICKLENYNAEIEYIENAFIDAERQTDVEVALIKVTIPEAPKVSSIITSLKNEEHYEIPIQNENQLTQSEFIKNIVEQYNFEVKSGIRLIN